MSKGGIDWKQKTTWFVLAFLALAAFMLATCEDSEAAAMSLAPETLFVGGDKVSGSMIALREDYGRWEVGLNVVTEIDPDEPNGGFQAQRMIGDGPFQLGIGAAYWQNQTAAWNSNFTFALAARYTFEDVLPVCDVYLQWDHYSTSGTSTINSGLDMLTVGCGFR